MIEQIAKQGALQAMKLNPHLKNGLSIFKGCLTSALVAKAE
jgi:alanine dehydrogenase